MNEELPTIEDVVIGLHRDEERKLAEVVPTERLTFNQGGKSRGRGRTVKSAVQSGLGTVLRCAICDASGVSLRKLREQHPEHGLVPGQYVCATGCERENRVALRKLEVFIEQNT